MEDLLDDLYGREVELARIGRFLESVRSTGDTRLVRGEPGVGKSALFNATVDLANDAGLRVLRATGAEFEVDISYSVLNQLLLPLRDELHHLPAGLRDPLTVAPGFGPGSPPAALLVCNAALSLLAAAAQQKPILLMVDDVQWVDRPSAVALSFIARRVQRHPIGLVVSTRTATENFLEWRGLAEVEVPPLSREASERLVAARFPQLPARLRQRVLDLAAGNPLALVELPATFLQSEANNWQPNEVVPLSERLQQLFSARISDLPEATRRLLLIATFEGHGDIRLLRGISDLTDLAPAERAQILRVEDANGRLVFRHPLMKSAIVASATHEERRLAHLVLADALAADQERRAWHLAAATAGPDENVATLLDRAAHKILQRGDPLGAIAALVRAADLSATTAERARRLVQAAYLGAEAGGVGYGIGALLDTARATSPDSVASLPAATAAVLLMLENDGDVRTALGLLAGAIETGDHAWRADDPALEEAMHHLLNLCWYRYTPEDWATFLRLVDRLEPAPSDVLAVMSRTIPDPVRTAAPALPALDALLATLTDGDDLTRIQRVGSAAVYVDRLGEMRNLSWRLVRYGREGGAPRRQLGALMHLCLDDYFAGRWDEGEELAEEGQDLCTTRGLKFLTWNFLYCRALFAAGRGRVGEAVKLADELTLWGRPRGVGVTATIAHHPRALAAAAQGDFEAAYRHVCAISPAGLLAPYVGPATYVMFDLVEAALRTGRTAEARAHADAMRAADVSALSPRMALVQRGVDALVSDDEEADGRLEEALADSAAERWLVDASRIRLAFGEKLRRRKAFPAARVHLLNARTGFAAMGAEPWLTRTVDELRATGHRPAAARSTAAALTAQEREIAHLAAGGLSNKQIAERLFLSHRTVGAHLHRTFRKLGIASRAGLRDALSRRQTPPEDGTGN